MIKTVPAHIEIGGFLLALGDEGIPTLVRLFFPMKSPKTFISRLD